jgi:hypothetical protein
VRSPAGVRQHAQHAGQRSLRRCPQGERTESIPLSPPHSKKSLNLCSGFFFAYCTVRGVRSPAGERPHAQHAGQRSVRRCPTIRKPGRSRVWALHFYSIKR